MKFLSGKKTYIIAGLLVLISLVHYFTGDIQLADVLSSPDLLVFLNGLGLASLRDAIAKQ